METIHSNNTKTVTAEHSTEWIPVYAAMSEAEKYFWARRNGRIMRQIAFRHRAALSTVTSVLHGRLKSYGPTRPGHPRDTKARRIGRSLDKAMRIQAERSAEQLRGNGQ